MGIYGNPPKYKLDDCTKQTFDFVKRIRKQYGSIYNAQDIYKHYVRHRTVMRGRDIHFKEKIKKMFYEVDEDEFGNKVDLIFGNLTLETENFSEKFKCIVKNYDKDDGNTDVVDKVKIGCLCTLGKKDWENRKRFTRKYRNFMRRYMKVKGKKTTLRRLKTDLKKYSKMNNAELKQLMKNWKEKLDEKKQKKMNKKKLKTDITFSGNNNGDTFGNPEKA